MNARPPERVQWSPAADFDASDRRFAVTPEWLLPEALLESVRAAGILSPLRVLPSGAGFRIVSGFRRFAAASAVGLDRLPVWAPRRGGKSDLEWFVEALLENLGTRRFGELENAVAVAKLHHQFGLGETETVERFLPLLGIRPDRRHFAQCLKIARLPLDLQRELPDLMTEAALRLATWEEPEQVLFLDLRRRYRLGRNRQRELLELLDELRAVQRRQDRQADVWTAWRASGASEIDSPDDPTPDRLERVLEALRRLRYPVLSECEERARRLQSALRLPPEIQFNLPRHFEGDRIHIQFSVRSAEELRRLAEKLLDASSRSELAGLFALL